MIKFSSSFKLNEMHRVDSSFNEDPKNIIFFQGHPNVGGGTAGKFRKNGQQQGHLLLYKLGVAIFQRAYQPLPPGTKILLMPQFSYMPDQFLGKNLKSQNLTLF